MNIFKILANGDGTINEANISAFLGYLLDPYQDHGLGHEFLDRFLKIVHGNNYKNTYSYNYEIELEQAFRDGDKSKQIVDIVLASFHNKKNGFKESIMQNAIEAKQTLEILYLIENKVSYSAKKAEQIKHQFEATKSQLKVSDDKIFSIYITPDLSVYDIEFDSFESNSKTHFKWILESEKPKEKPSIKLLANEDESNESNQKSIFGIIKGIIEDESYGKIEAINEYTKHTLISFLKFIENEFKSEIQEVKDKKDGKFQKDYSSTLDEYMGKYKDNLNENSNNKLVEFDNFVRTNHPNFYIRHTKTHPISILTNTKSGKIFSLTKYGKNLKCHFITRNFEDANIKLELEKLIQSYSLNPSNDHWGIDILQDLTSETSKEIFEKYINLIADAPINN